MSSISTERVPASTASAVGLAGKFSFRSAPYPNPSSPGDRRASKRSDKKSQKKANDEDDIVAVASSELRSLNDSLSQHYRVGSDRRPRKPPGAYKRLLDGPDIAQDGKQSKKQPRSAARSKAAPRKKAVSAVATPASSVPVTHLTAETEKDDEPLSGQPLIVPIVLVPKKRLLPVLKNSSAYELAKPKDAFAQTERSFSGPSTSGSSGVSWSPFRFDEEQLKVVLAKNAKTLPPQPPRSQATTPVTSPQVSGALSGAVRRSDAAVIAAVPAAKMVPMVTGQGNLQPVSVHMPHHMETTYTRTGQNDYCGGTFDRILPAGPEYGYGGYAFQNVNGCYVSGHYPCDVHTPLGARKFDKFMWDAAALQLNIADCPNIPTVSTFLHPLFYQPQNGYDFKQQEYNKNPDLAAKAGYQQTAGTVVNNGPQMWFPATAGHFGGQSVSENFLSHWQKSSNNPMNATIQAEQSPAAGSGQNCDSSIPPPLESKHEPAKKWIVPAWTSPVKVANQYYMQNAGYLYGPVPSEGSLAGMDSHEYVELIPQDKKKSSGENSPAASEHSDASVTSCTVE